MKFRVKHYVPGRVRIVTEYGKLENDLADALEYRISKLKNVKLCKVYERSGNVLIELSHKGRDNLTELLFDLKNLEIDKDSIPEYVYEASSRELNAMYKEKLVTKIGKKILSAILLPVVIKLPITIFKGSKYIKSGFGALIKGKMQVAGLDGVAITVAILSKNISTASSVIFLLDIGDTLEEWTHKRVFGDLAKNMALNVTKAWLVKDGQEVLVPTGDVEIGDLVRVHVGNVIPFDGEVFEGEALVNQSSITGEPLGVVKDEGKAVFAGTVLEEGEIVVKVRQTKGTNKYDQIVKMIEASERIKSDSESKAMNLADKLVPYTLFGAPIIGLLTGSVTKAMSVLMVDFSCALKLAIPISVLSAIEEASRHSITVKGGKFLEDVAKADTLIFDKTGTLTAASPKVKEIITFGDRTEKELLKIAACLEEHFPHSVAKAIVNEAKEQGVEHEEMHSKVEYIVAHGIATTIQDKRVVIGSEHFIFEDEKAKIRPEFQEKFDNLSKQYSHLFLSIDGNLEAVIYIQDPIREGIKDVIASLRAEGIGRIVMMTGDSRHTAGAVAKELGLDEFYAEVLPEDKAKFVASEKAAGRKVIMVGDGINDTPALSQADVGIAVSEGAQIALEIADVIIEEGDMFGLVVLRRIAKELMKRINFNYKSIVGINGGLIALGVAGGIGPAAASFVHNASTLVIGAKSTLPYLDESEARKVIEKI
ncbi:MAG: heavy metal translocating P-type ATPase [Eubacteriales bacterium]